MYLKPHDSKGHLIKFLRCLTLSRMTMGVSTFSTFFIREKDSDLRSSAVHQTLPALPTSQIYPMKARFHYGIHNLIETKRKRWEKNLMTK